MTVSEHLYNPGLGQLLELGAFGGSLALQTLVGIVTATTVMREE